MQQGKQPFGAGLQLFARLTLNAGEDAANQPARLAHLDDGNQGAILVQGNEGPAQVVRLGHRGTPSVTYSDDGAISSSPAPYHLFAGGKRIRTFGPAALRADPISAVCDHDFAEMPATFEEQLRGDGSALGEASQLRQHDRTV